MNHRRRIDKEPPGWLRNGAVVDFHSIIGRGVTHPGCIVREDPFQASDGTWVCFVDKIRGYVAIEALTEAK